MNTLLVGCLTMKNELTKAMKNCAATYPVIWLDARLHNVKSQLHERVQSIIDREAEGFDTILFATSFCGNAIEGVCSHDKTLLFPRTDDCTSLLLGGCQNKLAHKDCYFLTEGWLSGDANIWNEYLHSLEKYGPKRTERIFKIIFAHYSKLSLMDTGCYEIAPSYEKAEKIAETFSLGLEILPAEIRFLEQLLTGPWDDQHFLTVPPHSEITYEMLSKTF